MSIPSPFRRIHQWSRAYDHPANHSVVFTLAFVQEEFGFGLNTDLRQNQRIVKNNIRLIISLNNIILLKLRCTFRLITEPDIVKDLATFYYCLFSYSLL